MQLSRVLYCPTTQSHNRRLRRGGLSGLIVGNVECAGGVLQQIALFIFSGIFVDFEHLTFRDRVFRCERLNRRLCQELHNVLCRLKRALCID